MKFTKIHQPDTKPVRKGYYVSSPLRCYCELVIRENVHPDPLALDYWNGSKWYASLKGREYPNQDRHWFGLNEEFK